MSKQTEQDKTAKLACCRPHATGGATGCVYGMALIGAAIYYIQQADTFWLGVVGLLKAIIWPAILIYKLMTFLQM